MSESLEKLLVMYAKRRMEGCKAEPGFVYKMINDGYVLVTETTLTDVEFDRDDESETYGEQVKVDKTILVGSVINGGDVSLIGEDLGGSPNGMQYDENGYPTCADDVINFFVFSLWKKLSLAEAIEAGVLGYEMPNG
jgi:hypothetical protein